MNVLGYIPLVSLLNRRLRVAQQIDSLGTGAAGPAFFGLGVKQSLVILLIVDLMYVFV